mgnify:CR=1 FL=1
MTKLITVENQDAFATGRKIGHQEGVLVGISSGAAVWAAIELAKRPENEGKNIVVILPDTVTVICLPLCLQKSKRQSLSSVTVHPCHS